MPAQCWGPVVGAEVVHYKTALILGVIGQAVGMLAFGDETFAPFHGLLRTLEHVQLQPRLTLYALMWITVTPVVWHGLAIWQRLLLPGHLATSMVLLHHYISCNQQLTLSSFAQASSCPNSRHGPDHGVSAHVLTMPDTGCSDVAQACHRLASCHVQHSGYGLSARNDSNLPSSSLLKAASFNACMFVVITLALCGRTLHFALHTRIMCVACKYCWRCNGSAWSSVSEHRSHICLVIPCRQHMCVMHADYLCFCFLSFFFFFWSCCGIALGVPAAQCLNRAEPMPGLSHLCKQHIWVLHAVASTLGAALVFPGSQDLNMAEAMLGPPYLTGLGPVLFVWALAPALTMCNTGIAYLGYRRYILCTEDAFHRAVWVSGVKDFSLLIHAV